MVKNDRKIIYFFYITLYMFEYNSIYSKKLKIKESIKYNINNFRIKNELYSN
ncbi:hypothetical protein MFE_08080 [Mycoplasmopsis fermentans JER]|nr:hypothetical protein MFE_08080 [Mycoplasmopsis fermentans JER]